MATSEELVQAFKTLTDRVVTLAQNANAAREQMQQMINAQTNANGEIETNGTVQTCNGACIRDYEQTLEDLKESIRNQPSNVGMLCGIRGARHYIRALELQLAHGDASKEYLITGVVARGLISVSPNDGNQLPNYSSKSSSSSVPPTAS